MLGNFLKNYAFFKTTASFPQASCQEDADFCLAAKKAEFARFEVLRLLDPEGGGITLHRNIGSCLVFETT